MSPPRPSVRGGRAGSPCTNQPAQPARSCAVSPGSAVWGRQWRQRGCGGWAERPDRRAGRGREAEPPRPIGHRPPPLARPPPAAAAALRSWQQPSEPAAGSQRRAAQRPQTEALPLCTGVSRRCTGVSVVPAVGPVRSVPSPPALSTRTPCWSPAGGPRAAATPTRSPKRLPLRGFCQPRRSRESGSVGVDRYNRPGAQWRKSRSSSASTLGPQPCRCVMIGRPRRGDVLDREFGQSAVDATKSSVTGRLRGRILCTNVQGCCVGV